MKKPPFRIVFVCLGNICRSPLAEGVFRHLVREAGLEERFEIASAGTGGWHVGEPPDRRMTKTAAQHGVDISKQRAQQFKARFLDQYDLILGMDRSNVENMLLIAGAGDELDADVQKVRLFRDFDPMPSNGEVPDPYYGGQKGFDEVYEMVLRTCKNLLSHLQELGQGP
ncbi:MAG: low molecular weight phosphotyrosine protein phosphatase [Bacteroidetes Order II. Incertae sedis bacterium]|nr:low molecular weight phosphotyrosine protein phosphatase [Bacteroidetes Order II. bacterium]